VSRVNAYYRAYKGHMFSLLFIGLFYLANFAWNWPLIKWAGFRGGSRFIDLQSIMDSVRCFTQNKIGTYSDIVKTPCQGYSYTRELIWIIHLTRMDTVSTLVHGIVLMAIAGAILGGLAWKSHNRSIPVVFALFCPGLGLLFERGNLDEIVFILIATAGVCYYKRKLFICSVVLILAALIKFYTLPLLILLAILAKSRNIRVLNVAAFLALGVDFILQIVKLPELPHTWFISFGVGVFPEYLNLIPRLFNHSWQLSTKERYLVELILLLATFSFYLLRRSFFWAADKLIIELDTFNSSIGVFFAGAFITCYLTGVSYDYRLIFYAATFLVANNLWNSSTKFIRYLIFISLFFTTIFPAGKTNARTAFQFIGDFAMLLILPMIFEWWISNIRNLSKENNSE